MVLTALVEDANLVNEKHDGNDDADMVDFQWNFRCWAVQILDTRARPQAQRDVKIDILITQYSTLSCIAVLSHDSTLLWLDREHRQNNV